MLTLAPLYDVMSTLSYGDERLAMYVDDVRRIDRVTAPRIVNEASAWGMSRRRAVEIVEELLDRIPAAAERAGAETSGLPDEIPSLVEAQLGRLRSSE